MSATSLPQSADRLSQTKHSAPTTTSVTPATSFDNISSTGQQFSGVAGLRAHAANLTTATATAKPSAQGMESPPPTPRHVKSHPTIATTTTTATATISSSGSSSSSDVGAVGNADDSWTLNHPTAPTPTASATATSTATATPIAPITPEADDADDALLVQEIAEGLGMDPFLVRCGLATPANVAAQASRPIAPSSAHEPIRRRHSAPEPGVVKKIQRARKVALDLRKMESNAAQQQQQQSQQPQQQQQQSEQQQQQSEQQTSPNKQGRPAGKRASLHRNVRLRSKRPSGEQASSDAAVQTPRERRRTAKNLSNMSASLGALNVTSGDEDEGQVNTPASSIPQRRESFNIAMTSFSSIVSLNTASEQVTPVIVAQPASIRAQPLPQFTASFDDIDADAESEDEEVDLSHVHQREEGALRPAGDTDDESDYDSDSEADDYEGSSAPNKSSVEIYFDGPENDDPLDSVMYQHTASTMTSIHAVHNQMLHPDSRQVSVVHPASVRRRSSNLGYSSANMPGEHAPRVQLKRRVSFNTVVDIARTHAPDQYDRTTDVTPRQFTNEELKAIKHEMIRYKYFEMEVHPDAVKFISFRV